jgi:2,3,4,5-tetrahydropyridine-2,6-dicarboxylate N-succinyltransferase
VIIEDNCFIGARSEVAEGVIVREVSVLSMGVFVGASTKIVDRETGKVLQGEVPPYSVVVPGSMPGTPNKTGAAAPNLHAPNLHAPNLHAPNLHAPSLHAPSLHAPSLHAPSLHAPSLHAPSLHAPSLYCAVIVKRVDEKTRAKTSINELLRD